MVGSRDAPAHRLPAFVCGSSTYSGDILAAEIPLPRLKRGDLLMFRNAGAYCRSMMTDFLGKARPEEFFVENFEAGMLSGFGPATSLLSAA